MYAHRLCECHTWNIPLLRQDRTRGSECTPVSTPHLAADCLREVQIKAIVSWSEHHWFRGIFYTAVWDSTGSADTTPGSRVSLHVPSFPFTRRNVFSGSQFKVSETDIKFSCHKVLVDNETNKTKQSRRATYVTPVTHVALGDCSLEWEWIPFTLKPEN